MSNEQRPLSKSQSGPLKACAGCVELNELRHSIAAAANDIAETEERLEALGDRVSQHDVALATLTERVLQSVDGLRREFAAAAQIAVLERKGLDVRTTTPPGKSELKLPGGVAWRAPTWAIVLVLLVAVLFGGGLAAGAYVAGKWGPPSKSGQK